MVPRLEEDSIPLNPNPDQEAGRAVEKTQATASGAKMMKLLSNPSVWTVVVYSFIYVSTPRRDGSS
jgi:fucose permease